MSSYIGRFAPSPTGALHAGSLVAALASWLDARAHGGRWLVRMEDVDVPRCVAGMDVLILQQLAAFGLVSDAPVVYQSRRTVLYESALARLQAQGAVYRCFCSRRVLPRAVSNLSPPVYPGTCRVLPTQLLAQKIAQCEQARQPFAWRLRVGPGVVAWQDRRLGWQNQNVARDVGDFVIKRADGWFAYQLAVVVDDAAQGITHIVRGEDLVDNTARQMELHRALIQAGSCDLPSVQKRYLHVPLVLAADGRKLSKQNGAKPLDMFDPVTTLHQAAQVLGLQSQAQNVAQALHEYVGQWRANNSLTS